jgi:hypothetical protein
MALVAPWDESKYKRAPMGASGSSGGQFVTKGFKSAPDNQKASKAVAAMANQAISGAMLAPVRQYLADTGLINRALRGLDQMDPRVKQLVAKVDAALAQSRMPQSVVAFREMTPKMAQALAELEPGDVIEDQGFVSASLSPIRPHNVVAHHGEGFDKPPVATAYKLLIPKGSVALPLPGADNEILIARGSRAFTFPEGMTLEMVGGRAVVAFRGHVGLIGDGPLPAQAPAAMAVRDRRRSQERPLRAGPSRRPPVYNAVQKALYIGVLLAGVVTVASGLARCIFLGGR